MKANKLSKRKYKKIARKKLTRKRLTRKRLTRKRLTRNNYKKKIKRGGTPLFKKSPSGPIQAPEPRGQEAAKRFIQMGDDKILDTVPEEVLQRINLDKEIENKRSDRTALTQSLATKGKESAKTVARELLKKTVPGGEIMFADRDYTKDTNKTVKENASKLNSIINLLYELLRRGNTGGVSESEKLESAARPLLKESTSKPINNAPINNTPLNNASAENAPAENAPSENAPENL
jgi:hypothetical protein